MAKKQFKAESKRLLDLMINSIYTHKEIFLRELISNASDAIDKLYYKSLADGATGLNRDDFQIFLAADKDSRTLRIRDNGIGMTQEELDQNLGVIAKSGSLKFKSENEKNEDIDIIGQFGVGFYSAFMVSDHVRVESKAYGAEQAYCWESDGRGRLYHPRVRKGRPRHRDHFAYQRGHRGRKVQRVPRYIPHSFAREEVFRLYPLPHPHGGRKDPCEGGCGERI